MSGLKTRPNTKSVDGYISSIKSDAQRFDAQKLLDLFKKVTGEQPVMWGDSIVGFGSYSYTNTSGTYDWLLTGFSARSRNLTLYIMQGFANLEKDLKALGKVKHAKSCLYINKLSDVDMTKLESFLEKVVMCMKDKYQSNSQ